MLAILFFHTESYMAGEALIPYYLYVGDALVIFFYLSGYLIFRPEGFSLRHKMRSILHRLVIPYLVFTTLRRYPRHSHTGWLFPTIQCNYWLKASY